MKMLGMTSAKSSVPQQTFKASGILGTPVPQVGDGKGNPNYGSAVGQSGLSDYKIAAIAGVLIVAGYGLFHFYVKE